MTGTMMTIRNAAQRYFLLHRGRSHCRNHLIRPASTFLQSVRTLHQSSNDAKAKPILTVGISKETYNIWEGRAPVTPDQVARLINEGEGQLAFVVQPSAQRIFSDAAYERAGATVDEDLSPAQVILGVKRPKDPSTLLPRKTYMFFSHTIKGQQENMGLLQECLKKKIQLLDYEKMVTCDSLAVDKNGNMKTQRLVAFGRFAGIAGTIDSFHAIGRRLLYRDDAMTPLLACPLSYMNNSLDQAKDRVVQMGERIRTEGMDLAEPLVFAVTGKGGAVHRGAMEILQLLPHEIVTVKDLPDLVPFEGMSPHSHSHSHSHSSAKREPQRQVYVVPVGTSDIFEHSSGTARFDRADFQNNPLDYRSLFASRVAPYAHCIINCVYWDGRFPRLLTKEQMRRLHERGNDRLLLLSDISCDPHGSIEFFERTTTIEEPFFQYDPLSERIVSSEIGHSGVSVLGVDILPTELPRESSEHFGDALGDVIKNLVEVKQKQDSGVTGFHPELLRPGLSNSIITTSDGNLTPRYRYLKAIMDAAPKSDRVAMRSMIISLRGHLFDSGLINQIADAVEANGCSLTFRECIVPTGQFYHENKSSVVLVISGLDDKTLKEVETKIRTLVDVIPKADAKMMRIDRPKSSSARVESLAQPKTVLLLGAGLVSKTCVNFLGRCGNMKIMIASDSDEAGQKAAAAVPKAQHVTLDVKADPHRLSHLVEESDLVISLLPAPMHPLVTRECLVHKKHLVTASYESDEMRALRDSVERAGVIFLNEVGLDPGLDHMSAMRIMDDIKSRHGHVTAFSSVCGGLPAPEAADNPLKYKFSWSPLGVIRACRNEARYRMDGKEIHVPGSELLHSATLFHHAWPDLELESLPNRDSLQYENIYGIQGAATVYRGTLRYQGFSSAMHVFMKMGLFENRSSEAQTWYELLEELRRHHGESQNLDDFLAHCAGNQPEVIAHARTVLEFLEMLGDTSVPAAPSIVESFCKVLEQHLQFREGERDMVVMHHKIEALLDDGTLERHQSSLQVFGDESGSGMAKTVGYTTAASAKLILDGSLRQERGLLLPTNPLIYQPVLQEVAREGIVFDESVLVSPPPPHSSSAATSHRRSG